MNDTNDDLYVPMMTETYDEKESFGSKAGTFCKKFLLLIITVGLLLFLIFQFILISGGKSIKDEWEAHKAAVEAADAEAAAAAEVVDVTPVVDDTTADEFKTKSFDSPGCHEALRPFMQQQKITIDIL